MGEIYLALVHYPVYNKRGEVIASALTTIDIHDLARLAFTYGLAGVYLVTPLDDQLALARQMIEHWSQGWGAVYNKTRAEALTVVRLARDLAEVEVDVRALSGQTPVRIGTSARDFHNFGRDSLPGKATFPDLARQVAQPGPYLIWLGTAWGLADAALAHCDLVLEPIKGPTEYNHLSVRSAASIIVDRLIGLRVYGGMP